jgi:hypothetical protein
MSDNNNLLTQKEINDLLAINDLISNEKENKSLVDEIKYALLNSGELTLRDWKTLRNRLKEIEELIPHIDMIIKLKVGN